jgi:hypothetical protein
LDILNALDPDPDLDPDSLEMLDPDPYPDSLNPHPNRIHLTASVSGFIESGPVSGFIESESGSISGRKK